MRYVSEQVVDAYGNAQSGASVTVKLNGSTATLYSNDAGTSLANPVTSDASGLVSYYINASGIVSYWADVEGVSTQLWTTDQTDLNSIASYSGSTTPDTSGASVFVPREGATSSRANGAALNATYWGPGQITTADGNKRGKIFSCVKSRPTLGVHSSGETTFNGVFATPFAHEHRITGAATLGQPTVTYTYTPEASGWYGRLYNESGHNDSTSSNTGRTSATYFRVSVYQNGQGDSVAYNATVFVTGTRASSTHFLANPAGSLHNGDISAGADGVYLNPYEVSANDNGYDVAWSGIVLNPYRSNNTGAKSTIWQGFRAQNTGTVPCDTVLSATGKWQVGIDFAMSTTDFGANNTAISLRSGQKIGFNNTAGASGSLEANWRTTTFNTDSIYHDGTDLVLSTGGVLKFGTYSAKAAEAFAGYITIKDSSGNSRKVMVCA